MDAVEHVRYVLTCPQCGKTGAAEWSAADGSAYLSYSDWGWRLEVSDGFERVPGPHDPDPANFYGRPLVCMNCGIDAERTEITGAEFFSVKRPAMHKVAEGK